MIEKIRLRSKELMNQELRYLKASILKAKQNPKLPQEPGCISKPGSRGDPGFGLKSRESSGNRIDRIFQTSETVGHTRLSQIQTKSDNEISLINSFQLNSIKRKNTGGARAEHHSVEAPVGLQRMKDGNSTVCSLHSMSLKQLNLLKSNQNVNVS